MKSKFTHLGIKRETLEKLRKLAQLEKRSMASEVDFLADSRLSFMTVIVTTPTQEQKQ